MFHVGRFDPAAEQKAAAIAARKAKRPKAVGNDASTRSRKRSAITPDGEPKIEVQKHQKRQAKADQKVHSHDDDDDDDSSSVPSSSDSDGSSSVPSSSDDEGDEKSRPTTLKVIAPSQPIAGDARKHKRQQHGGFEDEAIDDFDADIDIIESAQPISSPHGTNTTSSASTRKINDPVAARALRLSRLPIAEVASAKHWGLPPFLIRNLEADSYTNFFPIQCMVIPDVIESERNSHLRGARDVCCHAPTGSGKTLAFALPLLTALYNENPAKSVDGRACPRGLRRLRALVVLPGRDLAKQVYDVFVRYSKGSHIKVGLAVGGGKKKADLVNERRSLVVETYNEAFNEIRDEDGSFIRRKAEGLFESAAARTRHEFDPTQINTALEAFDGTIRKDSGPQIFPQFGGQSAVDILVATPGRLMDHLDSTPGFTLQHLRFLVIDEADRLINQNNQNWVGRVLEASNSSNRFDNQMSLSQYVKSPLQVAPDGITFVIDPITHRLAGSGLTNVTFGDKEKSDDGLVSGFFGRPVPLRKMLFSATLTQDPQKLARLGLVNPKHFDANVLKQLARIEEAEGTDNVVESMKTGRYSVPGGLREKMVECTAEQKPLVLLALLLEEERSHVAIKPNKGDPESVNLCVVFTSSIDSTHRLARLLQLLWVAGGFGKSSAIAEFSSSINAKQRAAILRRCRNGGAENGVSVLVCSDGMSRGMDLPSVSAVINYDVPAYSKTYVHRCGRTARAGREGKAISVLKGGQVAKFHKMRNLIDGGSVEKMGIKKDLVKGVIPTYKACVRALQKVITAEENEELLHTDPLDGKEWIPK